MENQKKHIDDLFRKELNDYQEAPGSGMWDRIEGNLNRIDNKAKPGSGPKGGKGLLGYSVGLILIAATAFFMYSHFANRTVSQAPPVASEKDITVANKKDIAAVAAAASHSTIEQKVAGKTSATQQAISGLGTGSSANAVASNNNTSVSLMHPAKSHAHTAYRVVKDKSANKTHSGIAAVTTATAKHHKDIAKASHTSAAAITKSTNDNTTATENNKSETAMVSAPADFEKQKTVHKKEATKDATTNTVATTTSAKPKTIKKNSHKVVKENIDETSNKQEDILSASINTPKEATRKTNTKNGLITNNGKKKKKINSTTTTVAKTTTITATDVATNDVKEKTEAAKKLLPATTAPTKTTEATKPVKVATAKEKNELKTTQDVVQTQKATDENAPTKDVPSDNSSAAIKDNAAAADQLKNPFARSFTLEAGARLGYEKGFGQYSGNKATAAVYAEVKLSDKFGLLIQPAIKYTHLNSEINYGTKSYYNNTGKHIDSTLVSSIPNPVFLYNYYGLYDSILVKSRSVNTSYLAFEVPVLLRYRLSNQFSVLGGLNFDIGHIFAVQDDQVNIHLKTSTTKTPTLQPSEFDSLYNNVVYSHTGTPYSSYTPSATSASQSSLRIGYMLGVDYSFAERFSLQFIMSQALTGLGNITDQNVKGIYSQPYFRFSIGYRFLNLTTKKAPYNGGL